MIRVFSGGDQPRFSEGSGEIHQCWNDFMRGRWRNMLHLQLWMDSLFVSLCLMCFLFTYTHRTIVNLQILIFCKTYSIHPEVSTF